MRRPSASLAIAVIMTMIICLAPAPAIARATVVRTPFSGSLTFTVPFFGCIGETITAFVTFKGQMRVTDTPSGGQTGNFHIVYSGEGLGDVTGIAFHGPQTEHESFNVNGNNGQFTDTYTLNFIGIRSGSADNIYATARFHVTVNANGETTSQIDSFEAGCRG